MILYLAAVETNQEHARAALGARAPHLLTSYFYAGWRKAKAPGRAWVAALRQARLRLIDSGAFTLRTSVLSVLATKGSAAGADVDYDAYTAAYARWLEVHARLGLADYWVEMDIGAIVGQPWVHRQREQLLRAGLGRGLVNVWHSEHDWDYWLYLLREARRPGRSGYVAIEGHQLTRPTLNYPLFLREAYRRGVRVHGFKMTAAADLIRYPFYSVDSSSWITPSTRGTNQAAQPTGGIKSVGRGAARGDKVWPVDIPRATTSALRQAVLCRSAAAWVREGARLDALWKQRGVDWEAALASPELKDVDA